MDPKLLDVLVCPVTKGKLVLDRDAGELVSVQAKLAFPIRDGIPCMLVSEARSLDAAAEHGAPRNTVEPQTAGGSSGR